VCLPDSCIASSKVDYPELVEGEGGFLIGAEAGAVVKDKSVAVGRKNKRNVQGYGVIEGLLHTVADAVAIVLGLNDGNRDIGLVIKDVIGTLRTAVVGFKALEVAISPLEAQE
jgi:hypothetical protein